MKFDPSTINTFYGLPEVNNSAYMALEGEVNYEKVISMLTEPNSGAKWRMHNGEYRSFPSKYFTHGIRVWHVNPNKFVPLKIVNYVINLN